MTKQTHGPHGPKNVNGKFGRRLRKTKPCRGDRDERINDRVTVRTRVVPLPDDGVLRGFLSSYMASKALEKLVDLFIPRDRGDCLDLNKEITDAAVPAVIHEVLDSELAIVRLPIPIWEWMHVETHQLLADCQNYCAGGFRGDGGIQTGQVGPNGEGLS